MSGETFRKLNLDSRDLDTKNLPTAVGANGTSLGAIGKINCEIEIGKKSFKQTFLVCENLTRSLILGVDFAKQHAAGVHWTKHNSFVLTIDGETVAETKELHNKAAVSLRGARSQTSTLGLYSLYFNFSLRTKNKLGCPSFLDFVFVFGFNRYSG